MSLFHKTKEELEKTLKEIKGIRTERLRDISAAMDKEEGIPKLLHDVLQDVNELIVTLNVVASAKNERQGDTLAETVSVRVKQLLEKLRDNKNLISLGQKNRELHEANEEIKSVRELVEKKIEQEKKEHERKITKVIIRFQGYGTYGGEQKEFLLSEGREVIVGRENLRDVLESMNLNAKQVKSVSREHLRFTMNKSRIYCGVIGGNPTLLSRRGVLPEEKDFSSNIRNLWVIDDFFRDNYVYVQSADGIFLAFQFSLSPKG